MATIVSIVSGKGGSGKSLLTLVLGRALAREGLRVLLVDLDIFVRGLTVLVQEGQEARDTGGSAVADLLGVFSTQSSQHPGIDPDHLRILRFAECDVLPAVESLAVPLDYDDRDLADEQFARARLSKLISAVEAKYDFVFFDSRAGMDSLVAAGCGLSTLVLAVTEDDPVAGHTNSSLVNFLRYSKSVRRVFTVINKGRRIFTYEDLKGRQAATSELTIVGVIPFDKEVMDSFGSPRIWNVITETLYFRAVIDLWNRLAQLESLLKLTPSRYHFPPSVFMKPSQGRYSLIERMMRIYGITMVLAGLGFYVYQRAQAGDFRYVDFPLLAIMAGVVLYFLASSDFIGLLTGFRKGLGDRK